MCFQLVVEDVEALIAPLSALPPCIPPPTLPSVQSASVKFGKKAPLIQLANGGADGSRRGGKQEPLGEAKKVYEAKHGTNNQSGLKVKGAMSGVEGYAGSSQQQLGFFDGKTAQRQQQSRHRSAPSSSAAWSQTIYFSVSSRKPAQLTGAR
jgi:folate-dependent tRNA-U54 methylase TrmFO/GidA